MVASNSAITPEEMIEEFLPFGSPPLMENQMLDRYIDNPVIHCMAYGDPGSEKSTFAASFPKPLIVLFFDPYAKGGPYRRRGAKYTEAVSPTNPQGYVWSDKFKVNFEFILSTANPGEAAIVLVHLHDMDVRKGAQGVYAAEKFEHLYLHLAPMCELGIWGTICLDSLTTFEVAIRKYNQYKLNPFSNQGNKQDARQWYGASAEGLEETCFALTTLPTNVVVPAHVAEKMQPMNTSVLWMPEAPGKRGRLLPAGFSEVYHVQYDDDAQTNLLQCHRSSAIFACTQVNVPNGVAPRYDQLWEESPSA